MLIGRRNYIFDDKYTNRDIGKYARLQLPGRSSSSHLLPEGEFFDGLHHHFSRKMHRFLGDEEEQEYARVSPPLGDGAHIQLTRRYGSCNPRGLDSGG